MGGTSAVARLLHRRRVGLIGAAEQLAAERPRIGRGEVRTEALAAHGDAQHHPLAVKLDEGTGLAGLGLT